jgi:hypothetical protein
LTHREKPVTNFVFFEFDLCRYSKAGGVGGKKPRGGYGVFSSAIAAAAGAAGVAAGAAGGASSGGAKRDAVQRSVLATSKDKSTGGGGRVDSSLPGGIRVVTWTLPAVINEPCFFTHTDNAVRRENNTYDLLL